MIRSIRGKGTQDVFDGADTKASRRLCPSDLAGRAGELLDQIDWARELRDLQQPPSNRLERLSGDRTGQWSVRINDRYRICFEWRDGAAWEVEITKHYR
jgi:proteic killer suppression protein